MRNYFLTACLLMAGFVSYSQEQPSNYVPSLLFSPEYDGAGASYTRAADGSPNIGYWQNRVDYNIDVSLNDVTNTVTGKVSLTYTNNSPLPLTFLWLQLDQNLFKPDSRGQARMQAGTRSRYGDPDKPFDGGYKISSVKYTTGTELKNFVTDTRMQVFLNKPLQKGEKVSFTIDYAYIVPNYGADRTGVLETKNGNIYAIAQWFPRMCVYDDVVGWNVEPYLGPGEFYCEYGDYKVNITAPANHVVVSGGKLLNPQEVLSSAELSAYNKAMNSNETVVIRGDKDLGNTSKLTGTKTWKYEMHNSRDFAWASSKAFIWDGAKINLPDNKTSFAQSVYPVESDGRAKWGRSTEYTKGSVENYSKRWFPYPYPVAVNVAGNISGMEYPGIVFCGYRAGGAGLWGVTDHEFGHTWFPMIVGSNERRYGWMDEGFNTFINGIASQDFNNGEYAEKPTNGVGVANYLFGPNSEGIMLTPEGMKEMNIGAGLYFKPGYALATLRQYVLGEERFDRAFRTYIERWAYKHPTPQDFFRTMNNVSGENLGWFWRSWIVNNYKLDVAVNGVAWNADKKYSTITLQNLEKMAMPVYLSYETISGKKGEVVLPVEIWSNTNTFKARINSEEELRSVTVDAKKAFPDVNYDNNTWKK